MVNAKTQARCTIIMGNLDREVLKPDKSFFQEEIPQALP